MNINLKILNPFIFLFGCEDHDNEIDDHDIPIELDDSICGCESKSACIRVSNKGELFLDTKLEVYAIQIDLNTKKVRSTQDINILINSDKVNGYCGPKAISIISLGDTAINEVSLDKPICKITNFSKDNLKSIKVYDKEANNIPVGLLI